MTPKTLIHQFWLHVFQNPDGRAVVLKNPHADTDGVIIAPGIPGMMPMVVFPPELSHISWQGAGNAVAAIVSYLRKQGVKKGDRIAILGWNSAEWVFADLAIQTIGAVTVPIYPHSAADQVNFVLANSGAKLTFSNESEQLAKVALGKAVHFQDLAAELSGKACKSSFADLFVGIGRGDESLSWQGVKQELAALAGSLNDENFASVMPEDLATIIYTSGSTGVPKGGCLTHGNIASACRALIEHGFKQDSQRDLYLSFLPLAHVYERVDGMSMSIWNGVPVAFCKVDEVGAALKLYRPSIMLGVPAVWRKIKEAIDSKLKEASGLKKTIADWAFRQKSGLCGFIADLLVFRKIRNQLGGNLRILLSGGAPISPDLIQFFNLIGLELLQGYGLTETAGGVTTNRPSKLAGFKNKTLNKVGSVGQAAPCVKIRIVPEPGNEGSGQGEIHIAGPLVFKGYWNLPAETAATFSSDGWFKTGDLGRIDEEGFLFITGRKKRLLKTEGGKYVAPEKIEKGFEPFPIAQYVVPVGDGRKYISAFIFVNQQVAKQLVGRPVPQGVEPAAWLAQQSEVRKQVEEAVNTVNSKLERWETLKRFAIMSQEASVANGLLTPTLKIRSEEVLKRFARELESLYEN